MSVVDVYQGLGHRSETTSALTPFTWAHFDVEILTSPASLEADWRALERSGVASLFQTWHYVGDWLRTAAQASGETPYFVAGSHNREAAFILPLAIRRVGGVKVLMWLGQAHSNYGMGLYRRDVLEAQGTLSFDTLIREIARRAGAHLVHLDMQPVRWMGFDNPFATSTASLLTANDSYVVHLEDDFQAQYKRLFSATSLSKMRRKWRRIEELGTAEFQHPEAEADRTAALDWFIDTKGEQLSSAGRPNPFAPDYIRKFYHALSRGRDSFLIDQLIVNGQREALGFSARDGRTGYYLNTVYANSPVTRYSPGFHLTHQLVSRLHESGVRVFDMGPGEVAYKFDWEPEIINLRAATHLISPLGIAQYLSFRSAVFIKSALKRNPTMINLVRRVLAWKTKLR